MPAVDAVAAAPAAPAAPLLAPAAPGAPAAPLLAPGAPDAVEQLQRDVEGLQEEFRGFRVQTECDIDHISCVQACHGFVFCMLYMYIVYLLHQLWFAH